VSDLAREIVDLYKTREALRIWALMDLMRHGEVRPFLGDEIGRASREIEELIGMLSFREWKKLPEEVQGQYELLFARAHRRCPRCGSKIVIERRRTSAGRNRVREETSYRCSLCSFEKSEERFIHVGEDCFAVCVHFLQPVEGNGPEVGR